MEQLVLLNHKLEETERFIVSLSDLKRSECELLLNAFEICDYEIEANVTYFLSSSDAEYKENDDNILVEQRLGITSKSQFFNFEIDHKEIGYEYPDSIKDIKHCYLFHDLYDHQHLSWEDCLRIDSIWVDVKVIHQNSFNVKPLKFRIKEYKEINIEDLVIDECIIQEQ